MPFQHQWVIPGQVYYGKYWGEVDEADVAAIVRDATERLAVAAEKLHYIADSLEVTKTPKSLTAVRQLIELVRHPKVGYYIVIGKPKVIVDFFITAIVTATKVRYYRADSYEDAIAFLKEVDRDLDWSRYTEPQQESLSSLSQ